MENLSKATYKRPWLYPKQQEAIFDKARYSVIEASTKSGKTVGCMIWLVEQAICGQAGRNYQWVAPSYRQTDIAFRRLKEGLPRQVYTANESKMNLQLLNGTTLWFLTAEKPDNLYGEDVYAAVLDEASRMREAAWYAVRTTLTATKGPVRIIGNVKGRKNWFYRMARRAEAGEPEMAYHKLTWMDAVAAGILEQAEVADARRHLPEKIFEELYCAQASDDEGNPFGIDAIRKCLLPLVDDASVAWGWDLAKSVDWTVGIGLNALGQVCGFERFQLPWEETFQRIVRITGRTKALVDSTGVGDPILERLQRDGGRNFEGYHFSNSSKQRLMEGLAVGIQRQEVAFPPGVIQSELESFEYEYTRTGVRYSAPEGMHDDCVCALALAVQLAGQPVASWGFYASERETITPTDNFIPAGGF